MRRSLSKRLGRYGKEPRIKSEEVITCLHVIISYVLTVGFLYMHFIRIGCLIKQMIYASCKVSF